MKRRSDELEFSDPFTAMESLDDQVPPTETHRRVIEPDEVPDPDSYFEHKVSEGAQEAAKVATDRPEWDPEFVTDRVLVFCEKLTSIRNFRLYKYQREFARRVIYSVVTNDGEELTALFARQSGKTEAICLTVVGLMILLPALAQIWPEHLEGYDQGLWVGS